MTAARRAELARCTLVRPVATGSRLRQGARPVSAPATGPAAALSPPARVQRPGCHVTSPRRRGRGSWVHYVVHLALIVAYLVAIAVIVQSVRAATLGQPDYFTRSARCRGGGDVLARRHRDGPAHVISVPASLRGLVLLRGARGRVPESRADPVASWPAPADFRVLREARTSTWAALRPAVQALARSRSWSPAARGGCGCSPGGADRRSSCCWPSSRARQLLLRHRSGDQPAVTVAYVLRWHQGRGLDPTSCRCRCTCSARIVCIAGAARAGRSRWVGHGVRGRQADRVQLSKLRS